MSFYLPLLFLIGISITSIYIFNRKFELVLPISIIAVSLVIYLFGLIELMKYGYYLIYLFAIIGPVLLIINLFNNKYKDLLLNLLTPGFFIFCLLYVFVYYLNLNRGFTAWDEFSHWGPMVTQTLRLDRFYAVTESTLSYHKDYPPIITLFEALWCKLSGGYSEPAVYKSLQMLAFSFFIPALNYLKWNKSIKDVFNIVGISLLMIITLNAVYLEDANFYRTIYTDGLLGITIAYGLYLVFVLKEDNFKLINLSFLLSFLLLSKQIGLLFFALILMAYGINLIITNHKEVIDRIRKLNLNKFYFFKVISLLVVIPTLFNISWRWYILQYPVDRQFNTSLIDISMLSGIYNKTAGELYQNDALMNFIKAIFTNDFKISIIPITYWQLILLSILGFWVLERIGSKAFKKYQMWGLSFTVFFGAIIYAIVMMLLYVFNFGSFEGPRLASFTRYLNTYWFAILVLITMLFITLDSYRDSKQLSLIGILILLIALTMHSERNIVNYVAELEYRTTINPFYDDFETIETYTEDQASIYIICQKCNTYSINALNYLSIDRKFNTRNFSLGEIENADDIFTKNLSVDEFKTELLNYDYLYLSEIDEQFINNYGSLFDNSENVVQKGIYKIDSLNSKLTLIRKN